MKNETLYVMGHLDLGDSIVMNGLIRTLLEQWGAINWFVKPEYVPAVASMMSDCERLTVRPAEAGYEDPEAKWIPKYLRTLRLGYFADRGFDALHWDTEFYRQAGVPFTARWDKFYHAQRLAFAPLPQPGTAILHERPENGWTIDRGLIPDGFAIEEIKPPAIQAAAGTVEAILGSPWNWIRNIHSSEEIHVIDSAFLCLVDSMEFDPTQRLVFHAYAKEYPGLARWPALGKKWSVIYPEKL